MPRIGSASRPLRRGPPSEARFTGVRGERDRCRENAAPPSRSSPPCSARLTQRTHGDLGVVAMDASLATSSGSAISLRLEPPRRPGRA
jgi:hypothetical protein